MSALATYAIEGITAILVLASGALSIIAALGFLRLDDFFQRLHPPALANTLGAWCAALASVLYLTMVNGRPVLKPVVLVLLLMITAPITTSFLARAALFRERAAGRAVPAPLPPSDSPATSANSQGFVEQNGK